MVVEVVDRETGGVESADFPEVRLDKRFVIQQQGRDFVLFSGLVDALHQISDGYFSLETRVEQLPTAENGQTAVCSALVQVLDPVTPGVVRRSASGIGDASPANVSRMMANATIRMAETRAKARALRDLCNVGMVSFEELGGSEGDQQQEPAPAVAAAPPVEGIVVEGRRYSRQQIEAAWRQRRHEAERLGISLPPQLREVVPERTPLPVLAGHSIELKRLTEATTAGQR